MRGLPGSRYLYQELEEIVTYRVEIPRQLFNKSREGEGFVAISGHHHANFSTLVRYATCRFRIADVGCERIGR